MNFSFLNQKAEFKASFHINNITENIQSNTNNFIQKSNIENKTNNENKNSTKDDWYIEIPSINLKANIFEGTTKEVMDKYIGHFEETQKTNGNIGLAAHNRGYKNNYFSGLKKLKEGDKIIYKYNDFTKEYEVTKHYIIKDTDWTPLEGTENNRITLITCVENQKEYRRCIQGEEIKK